MSRRPRPGRLYPREIAPGAGVFDLGYCSPDSFGASAWEPRAGPEDLHIRLTALVERMRSSRAA